MLFAKLMFVKQHFTLIPSRAYIAWNMRKLIGYPQSLQVSADTRVETLKPYTEGPVYALQTPAQYGNLRLLSFRIFFRNFLNFLNFTYLSDLRCRKSFYFRVFWLVRRIRNWPRWRGFGLIRLSRLLVEILSVPFATIECFTLAVQL